MRSRRGSYLSMTDVMPRTIFSRTSVDPLVPVRCDPDGRTESTGRMWERLPDSAPRPRLWTSFALAWVLVLAVVVWRLPTAGLPPARLGGGVICLALLALCYVWLTIRPPPPVPHLPPPLPRPPPPPAPPPPPPPHP